MDYRKILSMTRRKEGGERNCSITTLTLVNEYIKLHVHQVPSTGKILRDYLRGSHEWDRMTVEFTINQNV